MNSLAYTNTAQFTETPRPCNEQWLTTIIPIANFMIMMNESVETE